MILASEGNLILGYTENRMWQVGSHQLVFDRVKNELRVFKIVVSRPNGKTIQEYGFVLNR